MSGLRRNGAGQDTRLEVFGTLNSFGAGIEERTPMTSTSQEQVRPALPMTNSSTDSNAPSAPKPTRSSSSPPGRASTSARHVTDLWPSASPKPPPNRFAPAPPSTSTDRPTTGFDMSDKLKIGLIGTGRIGQVHAASVAALPETVLRWVCDPFVGSAEATAQKHDGAQVTADPREVLESGEVDAIIVTSPTPTHVDLISAAIDAGVPAYAKSPSTSTSSGSTRCARRPAPRRFPLSSASTVG